MKYGRIPGIDKDISRIGQGVVMIGGGPRVSFPHPPDTMITNTPADANKAPEPHLGGSCAALWGNVCSTASPFRQPPIRRRGG
jgi:hypothetical protein